MSKSEGPRTIILLTKKPPEKRRIRGICVNRDSNVEGQASTSLQVISSAYGQGNRSPLTILCDVRDFSCVRKWPIQPSGLLLDRDLREVALFDCSRNSEFSACTAQAIRENART